MVVKGLSFRRAVSILAFVIFGLSLGACAPSHIPVNTQIYSLGVHRLPLSAALILPESVKTATQQQKDGCFGTFIVPIGAELEKGALQAFSQAFETVDIVRNGAAALGQYDVLIELSSPNCTFESHCGGAVASAFFLGILGAALAKQSIDVKVELQATITDSKGEPLLAGMYSSGRHSKTFGGMDDSPPHIGAAVGEALSDVLQEMTRTLTVSSQIRTYAKAVTQKREERIPGKVDRFSADRFITAKSEHFKDAYAVVIGLSQYKYADQQGLTNLIYADDDARAFVGLLRNLGWAESRIKLLIDDQATKRNIEIALESWLTKAGHDELIVLFWSGHGFPDAEDPERVYFACYDTDADIPPTGLRMDKLRDALEERRARNVILIADTCHAGKLITRGTKAISIVPHIEKMRRDQNIPKGWIFMVGADSDRNALEHTSWCNGAFTHCLINGLSGDADGYESVGTKDGVVTMGELRAYLNTVMPDETQRVLGIAKRPLITTSSGDPDIWGLSLDAQ